MHITRVNNAFGDEYEALKRSYATGTSKSQKCSNCGKSGHTKGSCPKFKKGKRKKKLTMCMTHLLVVNSLLMIPAIQILAILAIG
jgi:hypothetical protein